jgi:hypothetical protein
MVHILSSTPKGADNAYDDPTWDINVNPDDDLLEVVVNIKAESLALAIAQMQEAIGAFVTWAHTAIEISELAED